MISMFILVVSPPATRVVAQTAQDHTRARPAGPRSSDQARRAVSRRRIHPRRHAMKDHGSDHAPVSRRRFLLGLGSAGAVASAVHLSPALAFDTPSAPPAGRFDAQVPTAWFDLALRLVRTTAGFTPPVASRAFAYAGITLYEAIVPGMPGHRSLEGQLPGFSAFSARAGRARLHWPAVANAALGAILRHLFPTASAEDLDAVDALDASFGERFRRRVDRSVLRHSEDWGATVADLVFAW